jgi:hypothetical protein
MGRRIPRSQIEVLKGAGLLAAIWSVVFGYDRLGLQTTLFSLARDRGWLTGLLASVTHDVVHDSGHILAWTTTPLVCAVSLAVPLALLVRMVARARVRAGQSDPLEALRAWTTAHPRTTRGIVAAPALTWFANAVIHTALHIAFWGGYSMYGHFATSDKVRELHILYGTSMGVIGFVMAVASLGIYAATRRGERAFLAPTVDEEDYAGVVSERRVGFNAVAVTTETRAAVAAMAILPFLAFAIIQLGKLGDTGTFAVLTAYATVALGGAMAFRRASRIAVGVDGIFVTGSSRSRFFAYRDIDAVRSDGGDIRLVRNERIVLRLQLHGEDALQKGSILARIEEAVRTAKQRDTAAVGEIVASASDEKLARLAQGGEGYRSPSVMRSQLWSLVEGPEHDAKTRTSAARALAGTADVGERERLRVAASQSAEPKVRVALRELADDEAGEDENERHLAEPKRQRR